MTSYPEIHIVDKRWSYDCLISTMGFPIEVQWHFDIGSEPRATSLYWTWALLPPLHTHTHSDMRKINAQFLTATKQLYDWFSLSVHLSVCLSVRPSHLFYHVPIIVSSWNFQELLPMTKVTSKQKVKVRGQRSRSQRSTPNLTVSGL